jgi:hypothetical protein
MNVTTHRRNRLRRRALLALPTAVIAAAAIASPSIAATLPSAGSPTVGPAPTTVGGPTSQGIIMRDGGVCDPIRHMGC